MLREYLLGGLSEKQRERVEEAYVEDEEVFGSLLGLEDELVRSYLTGTLSPDERERFERSYLSSAYGRDNVDFTRTLTAAVAAPQSEGLQARGLRKWLLSDAYGALNRRSAWIRLAAVLLLVVGLATVLIENRRLDGRFSRLAVQIQELQEESRVARAQAAEERARAERAETELDVRQDRGRAGDGARPRIAALSIAPGVMRGSGGLPEVALNTGTEVLVLEIAVEESTRLASFRITLEREGRRVWTQDVLGAMRRPTPGAITVPVPAGVLQSGEYAVRLDRLPRQTTAPSYSYYFRVTTQ